MWTTLQLIQVIGVFTLPEIMLGYMYYWCKTEEELPDYDSDFDDEYDLEELSGDSYPGSHWG